MFSDNCVFPIYMNRKLLKKELWVTKEEIKHIPEPSHCHIYKLKEKKKKNYYHNKNLVSKVTGATSVLLQQ